CGRIQAPARAAHWSGAEEPPPAQPRGRLRRLDACLDRTTPQTTLSGHDTCQAGSLPQATPPRRSLLSTDAPAGLTTKRPHPRMSTFTTILTVIVMGLVVLVLI